MDYVQSEKTQKPNTKKVILQEIFWFAVLIAVIFLIVLRIFIYQQVKVVGPSMQPNYHQDEELVVNEQDRNFQRGQVVAVYDTQDVAYQAHNDPNPFVRYFTRFSDKNRFLLKRIVGLPGESIQIIGSKTIIYNAQNPQGEILSEPYVSDQVKENLETENYYFPKTEIPNGSYFMLGDNRTNSSDSRQKGPFQEYAIFGKETLRYAPASKFHWFDLPTYETRPIDQNTINQGIDGQKKLDRLTQQTN